MHISLLRSAVVILGVAAGVGARAQDQDLQHHFFLHRRPDKGAPPPGKPRNIPHTHERAGFPLCLRNHLKPSFTPSVRGNYVGGGGRSRWRTALLGRGHLGLGRHRLPLASHPRSSPLDPRPPLPGRPPRTTSPMVQTCQTPSQDFMAPSRTSTGQEKSKTTRASRVDSYRR